MAIPSIINANFADTVGALSDVLRGAHLQVLLRYSNYDILEEEELIEQFLRRRPEAIVLTGGRHTDKTRLLLECAKIPVIETWDLPENPLGHVVEFSNAATMLDLVSHLVSSDLSAFGALTECTRKGVAVPDEMAIAGFGAYDIASICVPTLTTVNPFPSEIGRKTGELIVTLLRGEEPLDDEMARMRIEPRLSVRQSSE